MDAAAFLAEVPERLFELLLVDYLAAALHPVHDLLVTLGVIRSIAQTSGAGRPPYLRRQLDFDRLRAMIADPTSIPRFVYGWGEDNFDTLTLFGHLGKCSEHTGALVSFGQASTSLVEGYMGAGAPRSSLEPHRAPDGRGGPAGGTRVHVARSAAGGRSETGPHPPSGRARGAGRRMGHHRRAEPAHPARGRSVNAVWDCHPAG